MAKKSEQGEMRIYRALFPGKFGCEGTALIRAKTNHQARYILERRLREIRALEPYLSNSYGRDYSVKQVRLEGPGLLHFDDEWRGR